MIDGHQQAGPQRSQFLDQPDRQPVAVQHRHAMRAWRVLTAAFLHSPGQVFHILFNLIALWMVGPYLETTEEDGKRASVPDDARTIR